MVGVSRVKSHEYISSQRNDVIATGRVSDQTVQSLNVVALSTDACAKAFEACVDTVGASPGLNDEQRLSALSELWLGKAIRNDRADNDAEMDNSTLDAFLQASRYAYAYLFYTQRRPEDRVFELRQVQVIGFYNFSAQRAIARLFQELPHLAPNWTQTSLANWTFLPPQADLRLAGDVRAPSELIPASTLRFNGVRNTYRRDGFGTEFVAVAPPVAADDDIPWREPEYVPATGALVFEGTTLDAVLATRRIQLMARNPYSDDTISVGGRSVPLAADFTAPYGIWLARSGFASQSIRSLLGREGGITTPRVLLMQPYDPNRLTVVMLHGLASSPEAWINVANEVMGDEALRKNYQVWEVYYPTNAPIAVNLAGIRKALDATFQHFDPGGKARASNNVVLVGHSMGGVISRLLVSSSGDQLWNVIPTRSDLSPAKQARLRQRLAPYLQFKPMPQVKRVVFMASPHRGTPVAKYRLARLIVNLIRLPVNVIKEVASFSDLLKNATPDGAPARIPTSIDNLSDSDPFVKAAADLPISPAVHYHTIVGVYKSNGPLVDSSDGVVPYRSAHLEGADSELAIPAWHSVQETSGAILELRRILKLHAEAVAAGRD
jgi:triacylglycerol esterase/lipase EstA (alpha/beta hydrolase family)